MRNSFIALPRRWTLPLAPKLRPPPAPTQGQKKQLHVWEKKVYRSSLCIGSDPRGMFFFTKVRTGRKQCPKQEEEEEVCSVLDGLLVSLRPDLSSQTSHFHLRCNPVRIFVAFSLFIPFFIPYTIPVSARLQNTRFHSQNLYHAAFMLLLTRLSFRKTLEKALLCDCRHVLRC